MPISFVEVGPLLLRNLVRHDPETDEVVKVEYLAALLADCDVVEDDVRSVHVSTFYKNRI